MENENVKQILTQIKDQCLLKGVGGIKGLAVLFRRMDEDFSKRLCFIEFCQGLQTYDLHVEEKDINLLFQVFDRNKSNEIDFMEFISKLQPAMSPNRVEVVNQAFGLLDVNNDGVLKMEDLKVVYSRNAKKHPKFVSGEWTEEQVLQHFLNSIDTPGNPDGKVTREEFMNYYAGVSSTVDDDSYFDLMMRACYGLPNRGT
ncbi:calcyphosin-like protein [Ruditapes philippinarum]|uniref:calcyphosin-like protein n=1 Tax=Ruditapes philippinarum TaxID=129788 RepID=UPI00295ABC2D|nr:calcyphosin-like protein [Ruditapes philippinarum]